MDEGKDIISVFRAESYVALPALPNDTVPAMAYVPFQTDKTRYDDAEAFKSGTLYPSLNKPFLRGGCK